MPRNLHPFDDLPNDLIVELRQIIAQDCGVVLSHREAAGRAVELLALVTMLLKDADRDQS